MRIARLRGAALATFGAAALFVLLARVDAQSATGDERVYVDAGVAYLRGDLAPNPEHPPLAKLLLGAWQLLLFDGVHAARLLVALVAIGTAAAVWWMLRRELGARAAVVPAALVLVADRAIGDDPVARLVTLESFVVLGTAWALAFAWRWRTGGSVAWLAASGAAMSGACLSKVSAVVMIPALLVLLLGPGRPALRRSLVSIAAFAATGVVVAAIVLAPFGGVAAVVTIADFQLGHAQAGHAVEIDGVVHASAPWWATLRFALDGVGVVPAIGIVVGAVAAWWPRETRVLVATLTAATVLAVGALAAAPVALPHYFLGWIWLPTTLAGVGLVHLVRRARAGSGMPRTTAAVAAGVVAVAATWSVAASIVRVATVMPSEADASVVAVLATDDEPLVYVPGYDSWDVTAQEGVRVTTDPAAGGITAVIVGDDDRIPADPALLALLAEPGTCEGGVVRVEGWLACDLDGELTITATGFAVVDG